MKGALMLDRRFARLLLVGPLVLIACLWPWPGLGSAFCRVFCATANTLSRAVPWDAIAGIEFRPGDDSFAAMRVVSANGSAALNVCSFNVRLVAYLPLSVFVALVVAAPGGRAGGRLRAIAFGSFLVAAALCLCVGAEVARALSHVWIEDLDRAEGRRHIVEVGAVGQWVFDVIHGITATGGSSVVIMLWALSRWIACPHRGWLWLEPQ
jgi:hypothetical protein